LSEYSPEALSKAQKMEKDPDISKLEPGGQEHLFSDNPNISVPKRLKLLSVDSPIKEQVRRTVAGAIKINARDCSDPAYRRVDVDVETGKAKDCLK
jgi:formate--tetrahydrofolate ligase